MIHAMLMRLTRNRPMRCIKLNGKPYLERYFMGSILGRQVWLHRFLRADGERHVHCHPWRAVSVIVTGGYAERIKGEGLRALRAGRVNRIGFDTFHRIESVKPGTWTLMLVGEGRRPTWHFLDEMGRKTVMATSPRDWWRHVTTRDGI